MTDERQPRQSIGEIEEWFLEAAAADTPPVSEMLQALQRVARVSTATAKSLAEILREVLIEQADFDGMLQLTEQWSSWKGGADSATCRVALEKSTKDRLALALIKDAGFNAGLPVRECLRRLRLLYSLAPGNFCYDGTWGFGVVKRLDDFYAKITIDFKRKRGHQMTFAYAGETLQQLDAEHFLVRVHKDLDGMKEKAASQPGEIVRLALASLGDMTIPDLKDRITEELLQEADWKSFWDGARKALKNDALVEIPTKRTETVRLLAQARAYDDAWFKKLAETRGREQILAMLRQLHDAGETLADQAARAAIAEDRVAFASRGIADSNPALVAALQLAAARLGVASVAAEVCMLAETPDRLLNALRGASAKDRGELLAGLWEADAEGVSATLLTILARIPVSPAEDVISFLLAKGYREQIVETLRPMVDAKKPGIFLACWLARHAVDVAKWGLADREAVVLCAIDALEQHVGGDELKAQKITRQLFLDNRWIDNVIGEQTKAARARVLTRIERSTGWDASEKRSVLARFIKRYPHLQQVLSGEREEPEEKAARVTSWRSLRERQEQYRKLIEEDIPANSKDIGIARSYGDLRENFEYQAAKDQQRLLLQRQAEMEADLAVVKGTDFKDVPTDCVGMGTDVTVVTAAGTRKRFCILGEWDRDEALGIISSQSAVAKALAGKRVGEAVNLPSEAGLEEATVDALCGLSGDVIAWAR